MPRFKIDDLPDLTKNIHESQRKWRRKNWEESLKNHKEGLEELLEKISLFSNWTNKLRETEIAEEFITEMFIDAFSSIHFACYGFYKCANMCLRSEFETALRLIFFSNHPIEYKWWLDGNKAYKSMVSPAKDVWGAGYNYFEELDNFKKFENLCDENKKLFKGKGNLRKVYDLLSQSIHTGAGHFQTRPDRFSPNYEVEKFNKWETKCKEVQTYINIILALGFSDDFKGMSNTSRNRILNKGIGDQYKELIKQTLNI